MPLLEFAGSIGENNANSMKEGIRLMTAVRLAVIFLLNLVINGPVLAAADDALTLVRETTNDVIGEIRENHEMLRDNPDDMFALVDGVDEVGCIVQHKPVPLIAVRRWWFES